MSGRGLAALLAVLAWAMIAAAPASAAVDGPRIAFVEWKPEVPSTRLVTVAPDGSGRQVLPLGEVQPFPSEGPVWLPDGSALIFAGYRVDAAGGPLENGLPRLYLVGAAGGEPRPLAGTSGGSHPVLSPDGRSVAFKRSKFAHRFDPRHPLEFGEYFSVTTWIVSLEGGRPRQLTPWRRDLVNEPEAFSPDGSTLLLDRDDGPGWNPEIVARPLAGGPTRVLARRAEDPAYSPDGNRIALVSYRDGLKFGTARGPEPVGELYLTAADGSAPRRLTHTPGAQELQPSWDQGGTRIAFLRVHGPGGLGFGSVLFETDSNGSCPGRVAGRAGRRAPAFYGPAWQPGVGREAGSLAC